MEILSDKIYKNIVEEIIFGKLDGESVLTEAMLIKKFGTSRAPIREALIKLCNEDILFSIPRYGYKVKVYDKTYLDEIVKFRLNIEPLYLNENFDMISKEDILRIENKIVNMDKKEFLTPIEFWQKTSVFHLELAYSYRDRFFYNTLKSILDKQLITFSKLYWSNWNATIDSKLSENHSSILNAIKKGNRKESVELLIMDINSF